MIAVEIKGVTHLYGERKALDQVRFEVERGEFFAVLGPNGGGKTTLFKILATLITPSGGDALVFGKSVVSEPDAVRKKIGVVFQTNSLDKKLTVLENLKFAGVLYGLSGSELQSRIESALERLRLTDRKSDKIEDLSGGLARRVDLAKSLLHSPELLILDEPSTGLDPGARHDLRKYLEELVSEHQMTVLITTHLMEEADYCHRIAILNEGRLVALGKPEELKRKLSGEVIQLKAKHPDKLLSVLESELHLKCQKLGESIRIEKDNAHEWIPRIVERFAGEIESVTLSKPTLEDVFIKETGHEFWGEKK